jgi:U3 small nucleolar RNA-associated protein 24
MKQNAKLKKIKKMVFKKKEKIIEQKEESSSFSASEEERMILNTAICPPYQVILDTNFINDCIRKKLDLEDTLIQALGANVELYVTDCVFAELEKLGRVYRLALNMIKSMKINKLQCLHKGNYADDCILQRVNEFKCYIVATSDTNLRQRIKKTQGIPIAFFRGRNCVTERFLGSPLV